MRPKTLFEKVWEKHAVHAEPGEPDLLYIDVHLLNEVTSPQAFDGLRSASRELRRPDLTFATADHSIPTTSRKLPEDDPIARRQVEAIIENTSEFGVTFFGLSSPYNGIMHVVAPELGLIQPGRTVVCGDSHTATHGAFGALAFGIGTSEVEHVMATQCLRQYRPKTFQVRVDGQLPPGVTAKDLILYIIGQIGTAGGTGTVIEYCGEAIQSLSMEERMTVCNMSIEAGARAGMIAPDDTTFAYLKDRPYAPKGAAFEQAVSDWRALATDDGAVFDKSVHLDVSNLVPQVTWGTNPGMVTGIDGRVPDPGDFDSEDARKAATRALDYMGLEPGIPVAGLQLDRVFIGSCTNSRIEDLRAAANIVREHQVASNVQALVVPGSQQVKAQAEAEGLDRVFAEAGFEWRHSGCSMCVGMNNDLVAPGERCASTSNRNFEGRQGKGARTHLVSPAMAAAAAIAGHLVDVRNWDADWNTTTPEVQAEWSR